MDVHLTLVPVDKLGRFRAELDGQRITKATRQPFFEAARELLKLGWAPETAMVAMHAGSATVAMRSTLGEAAKWTIWESDKGGLREKNSGSPAFLCQRGSKTAEEAPAGISGPE